MSDFRADPSWPSRRQQAAARAVLRWTAAGLTACVPACGPSAEERLLEQPDVQRKIQDDRREHEEYLARLKREGRSPEAKDQPAAGKPGGEALANPGKPSPPPDAKDSATDSGGSQSAAPGDRDAAAPPATPQAPSHAATSGGRADPWSQLRPGMTSEDVRRILGPPARVVRDAYLVYWHFGADAESGRVAMLPDGAVLGWDPPLQRR